VTGPVPALASSNVVTAEPVPARPPVARRRRQLAWIVAAAVVLALAGLFAWEVSSAGPVAIDDAYITFSYSKNLAAGAGPVYGHGVRVEGYSNFLWMVVVSIGLFFQRAADPLRVARVAAVPFVALLVYATYRLCRARAPRLPSILAVVPLVASADVVTAYLIGLETLPAMALLTCAFMLYVRSWDEARLRPWVVPALVAVALTRIDGFLPLGFVLAFEAARRLLRRDGTVRDYITWLAPGVAAYLLWFAWRWHYYGLPLPTTYYAKALIPKLLPARGWTYVRDELKLNGVYAVAPFALYLVVRRRLAGIFLVLYSVLHAAYVIKVGGDWMPYGRFLLPIFPFALIIAVWAGADLVALLRGRLRAAALLFFLLPAAFLGLVVRKTEAHVTDEPAVHWKAAMAADQAAHVKALKTSARLLAHAVWPGARLVTDYGGVFGYYTDAAPIEMWGLCNALIATKGGTERINPVYGRTCPECYRQLQPEMFHVWMPMVRGLTAFRSHQEVVNSVWQTDTIGRYLDFQRDFITGRVMMPAHDQAIYFLERRRPGVAYRPRPAGADVIVDYPFELGGRAAGL
jgi:hypothetical protein